MYCIVLYFLFTLQNQILSNEYRKDEGANEKRSS